MKMKIFSLFFAFWIFSAFANDFAKCDIIIDANASSTFYGYEVLNKVNLVQGLDLNDFKLSIDFVVLSNENLKITLRGGDYLSTGKRPVILEQELLINYYKEVGLESPFGPKTERRYVKVTCERS